MLLVVLPEKTPCDFTLPWPFSSGCPKKHIKTNTEFDYKIVGADKIKTVVTGNNPIADVCILPINNYKLIIWKRN